MSGIAHNDQIYDMYWFRKVNAHRHQTYLTEEFDKVVFFQLKAYDKKMNNHVNERSLTFANRADFR